MKISTILATVIFFSVSCTFRVLTPKGLQVSSQEYDASDGHITITVTFNQDIDKSTVVIGKTLVLVTEKDPNAGGSFVPTPNPRRVIFKTTKTMGDLLTFDPDGSFTLKLIGSDTGNGAIKNVKGKHLDGDSNNTDGGDYSTSFTRVG